MTRFEVVQKMNLAELADFLKNFNQVTIDGEFCDQCTIECNDDCSFVAGSEAVKWWLGQEV